LDGHGEWKVGNEDSDNDACELQDLLEQEEAGEVSRSRKTKDRLMSFTCAALTVIADDIDDMTCV
jgi:hypothetical protein